MIFSRAFKWSYHSFEIGEYVSGLINIPKWPSQFAVAFGALLISFQFLSDWITRVAGLVALPRQSHPSTVPEAEALPGDLAGDPATSDD